jgi:peptidoglycan/LPS O-acetylase OafA/YrhL
MLIREWIPYFCAGILAYLRFSNGKLQIIDSALGLLILLRVTSDNTPLESTIILTLINVFYFMVQCYLFWLANKPLLFLGTIPYSLYLIHQNLGYIIIRETLPIFYTPWTPWDSMASSSNCLDSHSNQHHIYRSTTCHAITSPSKAARKNNSSKS